jgi:hypothetical protein
MSVKRTADITVLSSSIPTADKIAEIMSRDISSGIVSTTEVMYRQSY